MTFLIESEEVVRGMAGRDLMRDLASRDLQRRIEIDDAMSLVVVRAPHRAPRAQRQRRLSPFERLDRGLLVHAQHDGARVGSSTAPRCRSPYWRTPDRGSPCTFAPSAA